MSLPLIMRTVDLDTIAAYTRLPVITAWETTRRRQRRERVAWNLAVRTWRLDIGRAERARLRLREMGEPCEWPF